MSFSFGRYRRIDLGTLRFYHLELHPGSVGLLPLTCGYIKPLLLQGKCRFSRHGNLGFFVENGRKLYWLFLCFWRLYLLFCGLVPLLLAGLFLGLILVVRPVLHMDNRHLKLELLFCVVLLFVFF